MAHINRLSIPICVTGLLLATSALQAAVHHIHFSARQHRLALRGIIDHIQSPSQIYVFHGWSGEHLQIGLKDVLLPGQTWGQSLATMYHITFPGGQDYGMKGYTPFGGPLTQNGTYEITVQANLMASNATRGGFRLTLTH